MMIKSFPLIDILSNCVDINSAYYLMPFVIIHSIYLSEFLFLITSNEMGKRMMQNLLLILHTELNVDNISAYYLKLALVLEYWFLFGLFFV